MNLKEKAVNGIRWSSISSVLTAIIQLVQLAILARYLDASDFGLMAIVAVVMGFSRLFLDLGISAAIIHKQNITHTQLSSLYWVSILSGIVMFGLVYILAPFIANFYNEQELIPLVQLLAITFIISSFGSQYSIFLYKELKFDLIAKISIISLITGFIVAISLAMHGFRVYALVYASLTSWTVATILNIVIGIKEYRPSFIYNHNEIKSLLAFGLFQMGEKSVTYFNSQFDVILIGKLLGVEALGIYTIAKNLAMKPIQMINTLVTNVTFPLMAKIQDDIVNVKSVYLKTISYLSSVNFPIYFLLILLAEPIVLTLFGNKWHESIVILQILSLYGAISSVEDPISKLVLARGRADLGFYWSSGKLVLMILFIYIGSFWELHGIAFSLLALVLVLIIPQWKYLINPLCSAGFKEYFSKILNPLLITLISGIVVSGVGIILNIDNMILNAAIQVIVMIIIVWVLYIKLNQAFMNQIFELIPKFKKV